MDALKRESISAADSGASNGLARSEWHQGFMKRNQEFAAGQALALAEKKRKEAIKPKTRRIHGGPIAADTRYAKVLASIYDDPFFKMLIQAGAIQPGSY